MTFFSVDVETSATNPAHGVLLTIGIVAVVQSPTSVEWVIGDKFYVRLAHQDEIVMRGSRYSSMKWWDEQGDFVRGEAYENPDLVRHPPFTVAKMIVEFVRSIEPQQESTFFVANPVSFDKPWLDKLFAESDVVDPFHYRSLCLRSMRFGMDPSKGFGNDRTERRSVIPHHALRDAEAQAHDLIDMLTPRGESR